MKLLLIIPILFLLFSCSDNIKTKEDEVVASGQMPALARDSKNNLHLVYGTGDSIMHAYSSDHGKTFSVPSLIGVLPELAASHTRGPQLAATKTGLLVTACNNSGDIFSYSKEASGKWKQTGRVNDMDTVAKENLMALSADGENAFAVWLDLRDKHNKIFGSRSTDGGKTWSKNSLIYASPDTTVCECCKPSVALKGAQVNVMFRNWLEGNRDLYLIQSNDGGVTFGNAQKLGTGSWALNGCPMDGGSIVINSDGVPQTVWRREGTIYASEPGRVEIEIGQGKNCTLETVNGKNVYAWVENGEVVLLNSKGTKMVLGKGGLPVLKAISKEHVLCVWEADKKIHRSILEI